MDIHKLVGGEENQQEYFGPEVVKSLPDKSQQDNEWPSTSALSLMVKTEETITVRASNIFSRVKELFNVKAKKLQVLNI